jgi:hypothetical protein
MNVLKYANYLDSCISEVRLNQMCALLERSLLTTRPGDSNIVDVRAKTTYELATITEYTVCFEFSNPKCSMGISIRVLERSILAKQMRLPSLKGKQQRESL